MGAALERLGISERISIARSLLEGCDSKSETRIGAHCPFHTESTKGGAFYYDAEKDFGFCHSCHGNGDLIDLFAIAKGFSVDDPEGFLAFWQEYGPDKLQSGKDRKGRSDRKAETGRGAWAPNEALDAESLWQEKATAFVEQCATALYSDKKLFADFFDRWGIAWDVTAGLRIGYNREKQFRPRESWGLPTVLKPDGTKKKLWLPQGFIFPVFDRGGKLLRAKIRLEEPLENGKRYMALEGGSPNCYGVWGPYGNPSLARIWVVVETERDAMYLSQELEAYGIGAMGIGTAQLAPDENAHSLLAKAELVINALDNDQPGGVASWRFMDVQGRFSWNRTYAHCIRWPVPRSVGKDAGDLHGKLKAWDWIAPALPVSLARRCEREAKRHGVDGGGNV